MDKPQYYVIKPSIKLFGGIEVTKEAEFDCYNDDKTVHQTLKDLVLVTEVNKEVDCQGVKSKEESKMTTELPEGTVLLWSEETGYIVPNVNLVRPEEALKMMEELNNITTGIEEGTEKARKE